MPYTLSMALLWVLLAVLLGVVIGWLMRSVIAKRQIERARSHHLDSVEMERLRGRVANLEPVVAERDRLQAELDACRAPGSAPAEADTATGGDAEPTTRSVTGPSTAAVAPPAGSASASPDLAEAAAVLGCEIDADDLKVIDGIGPKIEGLCHGIGIRTWHDLSQTEVSLLRTMLADAGPRFRTHDPSTWPEQATLLAAGRWGEVKALQNALRSGRSVE